MFFLTLASALRFDKGQIIVVGLVAVIVFLATSTRSAPRRCPRCREINRLQAIYCAQCGTHLPDK